MGILDHPYMIYLDCPDLIRCTTTICSVLHLTKGDLIFEASSGVLLKEDKHNVLYVVSE